MRSRLIISMTSLALVTFISVSAGTTATKAQPTGRGDTQGDIWPMLDQNPQRTHYSALENVINEQNVTALTSLWRQSINRGGSNRWPSSNPVTYGGNVYVGGPSLTGPNFFAFSGIFGTPAWPNYPQGQNLGHTALDCFGVGIGSTAAVQNDVISVGGGDPTYFGLDAFTGTIMWKHNLGNPGAGYFAWTSPLIYTPPAGGAVQRWTAVGVASNCDAPQVRGEVRALDLSTGITQASLATVLPECVGGTVWHPPALSSDGKELVITTGEDHEDSCPPGEPLARSIIVLNSTTFQVIWHHQVGLAGPLEDEDWATGPIIFKGSNGVEYVAATHKTGAGISCNAAPDHCSFIVYKLNGSTPPAPVWAYPVGDEQVGISAGYDPTITPIRPHGALYVPGNGRSTIYELDPLDGRVIRTQNVCRTDPGCLWGHIALANGLLYVNDRGNVVVYSADDLHYVHTLYSCSTHTCRDNLLSEGVIVSGGKVYWVSGDEATGNADAYLNVWSFLQR